MNLSLRLHHLPENLAWVPNLKVTGKQTLRSHLGPKPRDSLAF